MSTTKNLKANEAEAAASFVTLAILPFENLTEGKQMELFCKSFCIDLITELSKFRHFQIIAYPTAINLQINLDSGQNIPDTAADYYVQGSFRNEATLIRINVQLFDSSTHRLIWANRFEGKTTDVQNMQDKLYLALVAALQQRLNYDLLSRIRSKQRVKLKAYECWLYGLEELKKGSLKSDLKAREYFQQAIHTQPDYALAYSGMSLTYFNEWSCQLWERWEVNQSGAFEWAQKAMELDDQNYVAAYVLGRIFLYDGAYESALYYLRKSLQLNANDPDSLVIIASCFVYMELTEEAYELYLKALRLNPTGAEAYNSTGGLILFELGAYEKAVTKNIPTHTYVPVDTQAIFAAAYYHLGEYEKMQQCWQQYLQTYQAAICKSNTFAPAEAIEWIARVNPYKGKTNFQPFFAYISKGSYPVIQQKNRKSPAGAVYPAEFLKNGGVWKCSYQGLSVQLLEVKGFSDIQKMLVCPGQSIHCAELMGSVLNSKGEALLDEKARKDYQKTMLGLQREIADAEDGNDYGRLVVLEKEYEQLIAHLSQSLGLKGQVRKAGNPVEKARSAVTWRIRNAIAKIEKMHPVLGRHLAVSIRTGTVCTYTPEQHICWITS